MIVQKCQSGHQIQIDGIAETEQLAERLGESAVGGLTVALSGNLGAGKTAFTRGLAKGLAVDENFLVTSPTFVLHQIYPGRLNIHHFDTYRLEEPEFFFDLGVEEVIDDETNITVIEWSDRISEWLPNERIEISIEIVGDNKRIFQIACIGKRYLPVYEQWLASL